MSDNFSLCVIRHGQTDWNLERRFQGHTNIPLNTTGLAEAARLADQLKATQKEQGLRYHPVVYTSDLSRAHTTAIILGRKLALTVRTDACLRERHFGTLQGMLRKDAEIKHPELIHRLNKLHLYETFGTGEAYVTVIGRLTFFLENLGREVDDGATVLLVTHGHIANLLLNPVGVGRQPPRPENAIPYFIAKSTALSLLTQKMTELPHD